LRFLAVIVFLSSCGTQERVTPQPALSTLPAAKAPESTERTRIPERGRDLVRKIAALRGWSDDLAITYEMAGISRIREAMATDMHDQVSPAVQHEQMRFLESFGWVPRDFNLEDAILDAFAPEIVGIYSLTWRRVLLARNVHLAAAESVLIHELVHAFQDKNFGLSQRSHWGPNRGDEIAAMHALSEGEAVCITRQLEDPQHRGCLAPDNDSTEDPTFGIELPNVPPAIRYGLFAPYVDGIRFVKRLLRQGGWARVDEVWRRGVHSTGDLFTEAAGGQSDKDLPVLAPPSMDCRAEFVDILGEQGLTGVLFGGDNADAMRKQVSSLVADRAAYWRCGNSCVAHWHLRFRDGDAATRLTATLRAALGISSPRGNDGPSCRATPSGVRTLSHNLRDITITSVHNCDRGTLDIATQSCELESD